MRTYFITGVAGFLGSHLAQALLAQGHRVLGLDNFAPTYPKAKKEYNLEQISAHLGGADRFHFIPGDLREPERWSQVLKTEKVHGVIHLAALAGVAASIENPQAFMEVNVGGTVQLLEAMKAAKLRRLVFASSSSVYGNDSPAPLTETARADRPLSPYAASKRMGELLCQTYLGLQGWRAACLRFFTIYGPRQRSDLVIYRFAQAMLRGETITLYGDGSSARDYTYIDDAVGGILAALRWLDQESDDQHGVGIFNLSGGQKISLHEMVGQLEKHLGLRAKKNYAPHPTWDVRSTEANLDHSKQVLAYGPQVSFAEGIKHFCQWFQNQEWGQDWCR